MNFEDNNIDDLEEKFSIPGIENRNNYKLVKQRRFTDAEGNISCLIYKQIPSTQTTNVPSLVIISRDNEREKYEVYRTSDVGVTIVRSASIIQGYDKFELIVPKEELLLSRGTYFIHVYNENNKEINVLSLTVDTNPIRSDICAYNRSVNNYAYGNALFESPPSCDSIVWKESSTQGVYVTNIDANGLNNPVPLVLSDDGSTTLQIEDNSGIAIKMDLFGNVLNSNTNVYQFTYFSVFKIDGKISINTIYQSVKDAYGNYEKLKQNSQYDFVNVNSINNEYIELTVNPQVESNWTLNISKIPLNLKQ